MRRHGAPGLGVRGVVTLLSAHRWRATACACAVLAVVGFVSRTSLVTVPLLQDRLPARTLVTVLAAAVVLTPLYAALGSLSRTLVREPPLRPVRAGGVLGLSALAVAPAYLGEIAQAPWVVVDLRLLLALLTLGFLGVVVLGDWAGLVVLGAGFLVLLVTAAPGSWFAGTLLATPTPALASAVAVAVTTYVVRGPRIGPVDAER